MSLVLTLRKGQDFYVDQVQFMVDEVRSDTDFTLRRCADGKTFVINDLCANEVLPDVMISSGDTAPSVRLSIDAPRAMTVLRGDKYRNGEDRRHDAVERV